MSMYYLVFVQFYTRYTFYTHKSLPSNESLKNYYQVIHRDNLIPIVELLGQVHDKKSAEACLDKLSALAMGVSNSWASQYENLTPAESYLYLYDEYPRLQELTDIDDYYNTQYSETLFSLAKEFDRLSKQSFYHVPHIKDILLTYLLKFEGDKAYPLWSPLVTLEEYADREDFKNTPLHNMQHFLFPREVKWQARRNRAYENYTIYLLSEALGENFISPHDSMHKNYSLPSSHVMSKACDIQEDQGSPFCDTGCFCPGIHVNPDYPVERNATIDMTKLDIASCSIDTILALRAEDFVKHRNFVKIVDKSEMGGGVVVVLRLNSPCQHQYLMIAYHKDNGRAYKILLDNHIEIADAI